MLGIEKFKGRNLNEVVKKNKVKKQFLTVAPEFHEVREFNIDDSTTSHEKENKK